MLQHRMLWLLCSMSASPPRRAVWRLQLHNCLTAVQLACPPAAAARPADAAGPHLHQGRPGVLCLLCHAALCILGCTAVQRLLCHTCYAMLLHLPATHAALLQLEICLLHTSFTGMHRNASPVRVPLRHSHTGALPLASCRCWPTGPTLCARTT